MKKYFADAALIVFSVLFALLITRLYEDYKIAQNKELALNKIRIELYRNQNIIKRWTVKHGAMRDLTLNILEGRADSVKNVLLGYEFFNLGVLTGGEPLIDAFITNTAWETAKSTGIVSEFGFELTQKLTLVYKMQSVINDITVRKLIDGYLDKSSHDLKQLDLTLVQIQLIMSDLVGQEQVLSEMFYKDAIEAINNIAPGDDYEYEPTQSKN